MILTRLAKICSLISIVHLTVIILLVILVNDGIQRERESRSRQMSLLELASELSEISNYLTHQVRLFTVLGDRQYLDNYWSEINLHKRWDKIVKELKNLNIDNNELKLIQQAEHSTQKIQIKEKMAMLSTQGNDLEHAQSLVFGPEYEKERAIMDHAISNHQIRINQAADLDLEITKQRLNSLISILVISHILYFILTTYVFFIVLIRKITNPLSTITNSFISLTNGNSNVEIPFATDANEIGMLAKSAEAFKSKLVENQQINRELTDHKMNLEKLVEDRTSELKIANSELDEFAYRTSHDLKSPLISALGILNITQRQIDENDMKSAKEGIAYTKDSLVRLNTLVDDLSDVIRNNQPTMHLDWVDLTEITQTTLGGLRFMDGFSTIKIDVNYGNSDRIFADRLKLELIVQNLISNAIKYQDSNKDSILSINASKGKSSTKIEFIDNGIGVPEQHQADLFGMFRRFHPGISTGSGLGLYLVHKSVKDLGGDIKYSRLPDGSCFSLTIPHTDN